MQKALLWILGVTLQMLSNIKKIPEIMPPLARIFRQFLQFCHDKFITEVMKTKNSKKEKKALWTYGVPAQFRYRGVETSGQTHQHEYPEMSHRFRNSLLSIQYAIQDGLNLQT